MKNKSETIGQRIKNKANDEFFIMIIKNEGLINTMKQYKERLDISKGIKTVVIRLK